MSPKRRPRLPSPRLARFVDPRSAFTELCEACPVVHLIVLKFLVYPATGRSYPRFSWGANRLWTVSATFRRFSQTEELFRWWSRTLPSGCVCGSCDHEWFEWGWICTSVYWLLSDQYDYHPDTGFCHVPRWQQVRPLFGPNAGQPVWVQQTSRLPTYTLANGSRGRIWEYLRTRRPIEPVDNWNLWCMALMPQRHAQRRLLIPPNQVEGDHTTLAGINRPNTVAGWPAPDFEALDQFVIPQWMYDHLADGLELHDVGGIVQQAVPVDIPWRIPRIVATALRGQFQ